MNNKRKETTIQRIKKGINKFLEDPIKYMDMIKDMFSEEPKSLDEIAKLYSDATDEIILKTIERETLEYGGGKFYIELLQGNKEIEVRLELYFINNDDSWIKKENKDSLPCDEFTEEALDELQEKKTIIYKIEDPSLKKISNSVANASLKDIYKEEDSKYNFLFGLIYLAKANKKVEEEQYDLFMRFAEILDIKESSRCLLVDKLKSSEEEKLDFEFENIIQAKVLIQKSLEIAFIDGTYDKIEKQALTVMCQKFGISKKYFNKLEKEVSSMEWVINEGEVLDF